MTLYRRDFLRALASGTGAILIGNNWYKQKSQILICSCWNVPTVYGKNCPIHHELKLTSSIHKLTFTQQEEWTVANYVSTWW